MLTIILSYGLAMSVLMVFLIGGSLYANPRLWVNDYPPDIRAKVPPKTEAEKKASLVVAIPFLLVLFGIPAGGGYAYIQHAGELATFWGIFVTIFGIASLGNLTDLLLIDWLVGCYLTPSFIVLPGTEGMGGYKDYAFHFRGFLIGTGIGVGYSLITAAGLWLSF